MLGACSSGEPPAHNSRVMDTAVASEADDTAQVTPKRSASTTSAGAEITTGQASEEGSTFPTVSLDDHLDNYWNELGLEGERPEVSLVREVTDEEWREVRAACMTDAGFPPTINSESAGLGWEGTAEQADAFDRADYVCEAKFPRKLDYMQPYSTEQLTVMHEWMLAETIPCLEMEGYQVADVPTLETFISGYSPQTGFWTPSQSVEGGVPISVEETCPHIPPRKSSTANRRPPPHCWPSKGQPDTAGLTSGDEAGPPLGVDLRPSRVRNSTFRILPYICETHH